VSVADGLASQLEGASVTEAGARKFVPPPLFPFDFGGYRVLRLLGRGGMGAVYEAEQLATGRRVALKVLGQAIDSEEVRKRFLREGRLAASVNHPNSVYIFGSEEIEGAPVIAMELVAGGRCATSCAKGRSARAKAVDVILQVVAGLEAAASAGVLHRDVKPANCFVAPDGTVKVGDFGLSVSTLARHDSQLTATGVMLGTPAFAPPEQLRGDEIDVRADIYSVGATLYALLTAHAPFEADNAVKVVAAVLDKTAKPSRNFARMCPGASRRL
jgi:serine/threonine protein kinase